MYIDVPVSPSRRTTSPFFTSRSRSRSATRSKTGDPASPPKNDVLARNSLSAGSGMRAHLTPARKPQFRTRAQRDPQGPLAAAARPVVLLSGSARACLTAPGASPSLRVRWIEVGRNGMQLPTADRGATGRVVHGRLPAPDRREGADQPPFALSRGARGARRGQAVRDHRSLRRLPAGVRAGAVDGVHRKGRRALAVRSVGAASGAQLRRARAG